MGQLKEFHCFRYIKVEKRGEKKWTFQLISEVRNNINDELAVSTTAQNWHFLLLLLTGLPPGSGSVSFFLSFLTLVLLLIVSVGRRSKTDGLSSASPQPHPSSSEGKQHGERKKTLHPYLSPRRAGSLFHSFLPAFSVPKPVK